MYNASAKKVTSGARSRNLAEFAEQVQDGRLLVAVGDVDDPTSEGEQVHGLFHCNHDLPNSIVTATPLI